MTRKRRAVGTTIVIAAVVVAACLGPHLSSTAQEAVVTNPMTINFGTVPVGTTTPDQSITISPASGTGPSDDMITQITAACSDFTVTGPLPADVFRHCGSGSGSVGTDLVGDPLCPDPVTIQTADYKANFHPAVPGATSCSVTFKGTFGTQTVLLQGSGAPQTFAIDVTPRTIGFGDVRVATTSSPPIRLTVKNTGSQPLAINGVSINQPGAVFALSGGNVNAHILDVNSSDTYDVTCTPPTTAMHTGTLTVSSNATGNATVDVALSCRGTNSALVAMPSPVDLDTRVGDPIDQIVTITNSGGATANITGFAVTGSTELSISGAPGVPLILGSGANTTVLVRYEATTAQPKTALGKLTIAHDGNAVDEVNLSAEALATSISVNPDAIDFGAICAGTMASVDVAVFANAAGNFSLTSLTPPVPPFTFVAKAGTFLPALVRGAHANELQFVTGVMPGVAGMLQSKAVFATNIPNMPTREIAMRVEALTAGINATPQQLDFGAIQPNTTTPAQTVQLTNCGSGPLMVTGAHLEGPAATEFAIVSPADPTRTLSPTMSMELLAVMTPHSPGAKVATLVVEYVGGTATADLVGTALGAGSDDRDRRETYYRCSAGGAAGLGPVALALAALLRRRRRS